MLLGTTAPITLHVSGGGGVRVTAKRSPYIVARLTNSSFRLLRGNVRNTNKGAESRFWQTMIPCFSSSHVLLDPFSLSLPYCKDITTLATPPGFGLGFVGLYHILQQFGQAEVISEGKNHKKVLLQKGDVECLRTP